MFSASSPQAKSCCWKPFLPTSLPKAWPYLPRFFSPRAQQSQTVAQPQLREDWYSTSFLMTSSSGLLATSHGLSHLDLFFSQLIFTSVWLRFTHVPWVLPSPLFQCFPPVCLYPSPPWTSLGSWSKRPVPSFRSKVGRRSHFLSVPHSKPLVIPSQSQSLLTDDP